jgi:hypothetical protein
MYDIVARVSIPGDRKISFLFLGAKADVIHEHLLEAIHQMVVVFMGTDPKPHQSVFITKGNSPIMEPDIHRPNRAFS